MCVCVCLSVNVCVGECMFRCAYFCVFVFICLFVCVYSSVFVSILTGMFLRKRCVCTFVYAYFCVCICLFVCFRVRVYVCAFIDLCVNISLCMYVSMCVCICFVMYKKEKDSERQRGNFGQFCAFHISKKRIHEKLDVKKINISFEGRSIINLISISIFWLVIQGKNQIDTKVICLK